MAHQADQQTMQLVLIRHGESEWNKLNLFTGWTDVELTDTGREEAAAGGRAEARAGDAAVRALAGGAAFACRAQRPAGRGPLGKCGGGHRSVRAAVHCSSPHNR